MCADELRQGHSDTEGQSAAVPTNTPPPGIGNTDSALAFLPGGLCTPASNQTMEQSSLESTFTDKAMMHNIIHFLNREVKENTMVVDIDLMLKQAKPRDTEAADRAHRIYDQLCNSGYLTPQLGDLTVLVDKRPAKKKAVYPGMKQLVDICARAVHDNVLELNPNHPVRRATRLLQLTDIFHPMPRNSEIRHRPDIAITAREVPTDGYPAPSVPVHWRDIAAVIEVRRYNTSNSKGNEPSPDTLNKVYGQLAWYVLESYLTQPNRRFAWSIFIIHTYAYVCLFGRDLIYRTKAIDLSALAGRQQFAQFFIFWSLAGPIHFGLDPTIHFDAKWNHWVIECFDDADDTPTKREYYAKQDTIAIRDALFGRRTIQLLASVQRKGDAAVFIKDAWPFATVCKAIDDPRSEITLLRQIDKRFSKHDPGVPYPKLMVSGNVLQKSHSGWERDDTHLAFGAINATLPSPDLDLPAVVYRVHRRMVMTPLAERLNTLEDFNELIVVLRDAMVFHQQLYDECRILHRDVSMANIMVVRQGDAVKGMLVDFDNAIPRDIVSSPGRPARTATLLSMSISNLENSDTKRTALDDWESLLYIICYLGTYGFEEDTSEESIGPVVPQTCIHLWLKGTMAEVAAEKRSDMDSFGYFHQITKSFKPYNGKKLLQRVAKDLHRALFKHPACPGARLVDECALAYCRLTANRGNDYDPLMARVQYKKEIVDNCHAILRAACDELAQAKGKKSQT